MGRIARPPDNRLRWSVLLASVGAGCFPVDAFECEDDDSCVRGGVGGHCEEANVCSYPDNTCGSRRRYSPNAGALADRCVDVDASQTTTTPCEGSTGDDAACDCAPVVVGGRSFELCSAPRTWPQARDACALRSSTLASIHSDAENEALGALVPWPTVVWIGLSDRDAEGDYAWVDLSPNDYTPWGPDEPEDADTEEDCVALGNEGAWSVWRCETPHAYLCAAPP